MTASTLNTLPVVAAGRTPRGALKLNGTVVPCLTLEVSNNSFYQADTFRVTVAAQTLPKGLEVAALTALTEIDVEVFFGLPADPAAFSVTDLQSMIQGRVDDYTFDPVSNVLEFVGRDLTALLIDSKTTSKWPNKKSSDIAKMLAANHGLTASVVPTKAFAGTFYQIDKVDLTDQRTEWDLLTYLANKEQYDVYVVGHVLHFEPKSTGATPYAIRWTPPSATSASPTSNVETLRFTRNLLVGQGVTVYVRSWNHKQMKGFTVFYPKQTHGVRPTASNLPPGGQIYQITVPNKTQDECLQIAIAKYNSIVQHEMKLSATLPGDNLLDCRATIRVEGTGTDFDQTYYPDTITRTMDLEHGYLMDVSAKNLAPSSQVSL